MKATSVDVDDDVSVDVKTASVEVGADVSVVVKAPSVEVDADEQDSKTDRNSNMH